MTGSKNDIRELTLTTADIAAGKFTDFISINDTFTIRVVSTGGAFTGTIRVQRRNNEDDAAVGTVKTFTADTEEAGDGKVTRAMEYRIGALAGDLTTIPGSLYIAVIK